MVTGLDINLEHRASTVALNAHRNVRGDLFSGLGITPTTPGRCHLLTPPVIRREYPVVARQVDAWRRHQGGQSSHKVERLEHDIRGAVTVWSFQAVCP